MLRSFLAAIIACTLCAPGFTQTDETYEEFRARADMEKAQIASIVMGSGTLLHDRYYSGYYKSIVSFWGLEGQIYRCHFDKVKMTFKHPTFFCFDQIKNAKEYLSADIFEKYKHYLKEPINVLAGNKKPIDIKVDNGTEWTYHQWLNALWACGVMRGQYLVCRNNADPIVFDLNN